MREKAITLRILISVWLLMTAVFVGFFVLAMKSTNITSFMGMKHYLRLFINDSVFLTAVFNSCIMPLLAICIGLAMGNALFAWIKNIRYIQTLMLAVCIVMLASVSITILISFFNLNYVLVNLPILVVWTVIILTTASGEYIVLWLNRKLPSVAQCAVQTIGILLITFASLYIIQLNTVIMASILFNAVFSLWSGLLICVGFFLSEIILNAVLQSQKRKHTKSCEAK